MMCFAQSCRSCHAGWCRQFQARGSTLTLRPIQQFANRCKGRQRCFLGNIVTDAGQDFASINAGEMFHIVILNRGWAHAIIGAA
jgi:hypothetical protein